MKVIDILPLSSLLFAFMPAGVALGQLTPDNSLGTESSVVTPVNQTTERINGGAVRGSNLFHSFSEFNVDVGRSVYFANPPAIQNILTRVTGGNQSNIMGRLGVLGDANLFLVNPNGIVFGREARLDISGSFFATTGDEIRLGENGLFSATNLNPSKLLHVRPEALFTNALANHMAKLNNRGNLAVGTGSALVLHGGEVRNSGSLTAPGGTVMVLGERIGLLDDASIDVSSPTGGGNVLIGGFLQGRGNIPTAGRTYIGPDVTISADAALRGDGGNVIVWADEVTRYRGNISARGGLDGGDGGFVEVSGARRLIFRGDVDTTAAVGKPGTLLLDPRNIIIANGEPSMEIEDAETVPSDIFNGAVGDTEEVTIYESQLEGLSGDTNVVLQATNDIVVEDLADDVLSFAPGRGEIAFTADADGDGVGSFVMSAANAENADTIRTKGRDITISGATLTIGNIDARGRDNSVAPPDNAGQSISTAQVISSGPGVALETIEGTLATPDDVDIFGIYLSGSGTFSATVDSSVSLYPVLSLFDADGIGIYRQRLSEGLVAETPLTPSERGIYYLAVGQYEPVSEGGRIFPNVWKEEFQDVIGASGPGGALPLSGWEDDQFGNIGSYIITLTGTQAGDTTFVESTIPSTAISGNGGGVRLEATNGDLQAANLSSSSISRWSESGSGGTITINASGNISVSNINSSSQGLENASDGGVIALRAGGDITTRGLQSFSNSFEGTARNGGAITLRAGGDITTRGLQSDSFSEEGTGGSGGAIALRAGGDITTRGLQSDSFSEEGTGGSGGAIALRAGGDITTRGLQSDSFSEEGTGGSGGAIALRAGGDITTDFIWSLSSSEEGTGGSGGVIALRAGGDITTERIWSNFSSEEGTGGSGGAISLTAGGDITTDEIQSDYKSFEGAGNGGAVDITAGGHITTDWIDSDSNSSEGTGGSGGAIALRAGGDITTDEIQSDSNSFEGTAGNGGAIALTAGGDITIEGDIKMARDFDSSSSSTAGTAGDGGVIALRAGGDITIFRNFDSSSSSTAGTAGDGGEIVLEASGAIAIKPQNSDLLLEELGTFSFTAQNSDLLEIDSRGNSGGNITITSHTEKVSLSNTLLNSNAQGNGDSGQIDIAADSVTLENTEVNTSIFGKGGGGNITITTSRTVDLDRSRLFSGVEPEATGNGGNIEITAESVNLRNASLIDTATFGQGKAGDVEIEGSAVSLDNSTIFSITAGNGNGGKVSLGVSETLTLTSSSNISTAANRTAAPMRDGGDIEIRARSLYMTGGSQLQALTRANGDSGNITIDVTEDIEISGIGSDGLVSGVFTSTGENGLQGGEINVTANGNLILKDGGVLSAETASSEAAGRGGKITVEANRVELRNGGQLLTNSSQSGGAGNITVNVTQGVMVTGVDPNFEGRPIFREPPRQNVNRQQSRILPEIEQLHDSRENAQQLDDEAFSIDITDNNLMVELSNRIPYVSIEGRGDGTVDVYSFEVTAGTRGVFDIDNGHTGNGLPSDVDTIITLFNERGEELASNNNANSNERGEELASNNNANSLDSYLSYVFGEPGTYFIEVGESEINFFLDDNSLKLTERTVGIPDGGTYTLQVSLETPNVTGSVVETRPNSGMFARASGAGAAGNITVNAPQLTVSDGASISATTTQEATTTQPGGSITINAEQLDLLQTDNSSSIEAQTLSRSPAGTITLQPLANSETLRVNLENGFEISASTEASGAGGDLIINAPSSVMLTGDGILSVETSGAGRAGNAIVSTPSLNISEQVRVSATATESATSESAGGSITVNANQINLSGASRLEAQTTGVAPAGSVTLKPFETHSSLRVNLSEGTQISASTAGRGPGGDLELNAPRSITLTGKGEFSVETSGAGTGGNARINTDSLRLTEGARITASSSESAEGAAGNISIAADFIELDNASVEAETAAGERGNINISTSDLRLFNSSAINTNATETATGGNITIDTNLLFAEEGSTISANADLGEGGNIQINAEGVFVEKY